MNKFKFGQRVKIIRTGKIGEIILVDDVDFNKNGWTNCCYQVALEGGDVYWFTVHDLELVKKILNEKEKEYLNNVIKPFRNRVTYIKKIRKDIQEYISINIKNDLPINLPYFLECTMYNGMELDRKYTLSELELEE